MRRIALYSDIHANAPALEAVFVALAESGIEQRYCLGDLVGYGSAPVAVIAGVRACGDEVVRGNYDEGIGQRLGDCGCYYATAEAAAEGAESYARTDAALDDDEHDYLAGLLDEVRLEIEGTRVLLVHGSPRLIYEYLMPDRPDSNLRKLADEAGADVVCVGHVHIPYHRALQGGDGRPVHYVSDGSVGKPKDGDARACWAELVFGDEAEVREACPDDASIGETAGGQWLGVVFHRVGYEGMSAE